MTLQPDRLLVVDDNKVNRMLLVRSLEQQGHHVAAAVNGREALDLLRADPFDLVLLDIEMPEMDGYQVLSAMKQDLKLRHIPVIMVTSVEEIESAIRCIEMGAEDYLPKPFNPVLLRARLNASLEKKHLRDKEQLYLKSLERELEIGREIQASFLPTSLPQAPGWEIAASLKSAKEVAGDFYDAFYIEPERKICFVIADVCDKGVGAALFMTLFRSLLRFTISAADVFGERSPDATVKYAITLTNNYIASTHGETGMFATIFVGMLDTATGILHYVNAGHESPLIVNSSGVSRSLDRTGPAAGIIAGVEFEVQEIQIRPGELLFAYTDGASDALNSSDEPFGRNRLAALLKNSAPAEMLLYEVSIQLESHIAEADQFDDITLVAIRRAG